MLSISGYVSSVIAVALPMFTVVGTPRWRERPEGHDEDQVGAGDLGALGDDPEAGARGDDRLGGDRASREAVRESRRG